MLPAAVAQQVKETLLDYLRTTFNLRNRELDAALFAFLQDRQLGLFRGPYIDVRLPFRQAEPGGALPIEVLPAFPPFAHQLPGVGAPQFRTEPHPKILSDHDWHWIREDRVLPLSNPRSLPA